MELVHTETDKQGIEYRLFIEQDVQDVRGNAMASGADVADRKYEDEIIARLNDGDVWVWAQIKCEARFKGFKGNDYLGACCYRDTAEFIQPGGYWDDMKAEAKAQLIGLLEDSCEAWHELTNQTEEN